MRDSRIRAYAVDKFFCVELDDRGIYHAAGGTYNHYFVEFLSPQDLAYTTVKAVVFAAAVIIIHRYYGYFASGGPAGVGQSLRSCGTGESLVAVMTLDFVLTVMLWGLKRTFVLERRETSS